MHEYVCNVIDIVRDFTIRSNTNGLGLRSNTIFFTNISSLRQQPRPHGKFSLHFIFFSKNFLPLSPPLFSLPLTLPLTKLIPTKFGSSFFCISGRLVSLIDPSSSWFKVKTLKAWVARCLGRARPGSSGWVRRWWHGLVGSGGCGFSGASKNSQEGLGFV